MSVAVEQHLESQMFYAPEVELLWAMPEVTEDLDFLYWVSKQLGLVLVRAIVSLASTL